MSRKLDGSEGSREPRVRLRAAEPEDLHPLMEMARQSHHFSHFFRDPYLPKEAKREIFSAYLARSFGQENRPILVAEDEQGGLTGFSLLLCPAKQEERIGQTVGIVDFMVVKEETKGQGIGGQLLTASFAELMARGYRYVELKTMLENIPALNFYQRHGLRILSAEMHFSFGGGASRWH
jgi:ribosomal protein S18 acetylase RimI-like enzyme